MAETLPLRTFFAGLAGAAVMLALAFGPGLRPGAAQQSSELHLEAGTAAENTAVPEPDPQPGLKDALHSGIGPETGLPLPRYVSLKGTEGNARRGPSLSHRIDWVFKLRGMPLRVTAEFGHWRRVEDRDGAGGWVHYALLSGVRTVIVEQDMLELHARPDPKSDVTARAEAGAILRLGKCEPKWCEISAEDAEGWVPKTTIWGVDPDETRN